MPRHAAKLLAVVLLLPGAVSGQDVEAVASRPYVATHYFYWYRWPDQHFNQAGAPGPEGHLHHFPKPEKVSYLDPAWHASQFREMRACGIDAALPVYWGAPGAYERPAIRFSRDGLGAMVSAAAQEGVHLGLFYDTSTLLNAVRGAEPARGRADLTKAEGRALFHTTVIEYFDAVPEPLWARVRGRPLVVLYGSGFAARWDEGLGEGLRDAFARRFTGERPFLVADASWGDIGQDRTTSWGAALHGPRLHPGVAQIGPGYDDGPVPGRTTPVRDREEGAFYRYSWRAAVEHRPELVLIETWNEMHEGTEVCETVETGRRYLDLTAQWIRKLRSDADAGPPITLRWPRPRPRPDLSWGRDAAGAASVSAVFGPKVQTRGLRARPWEDGSLAHPGGILTSPASSAPVRYVYLQVADAWRFDVGVATPLRCSLTVTTAEPCELACEYDSNQTSATLDGAYTPTLATRDAAAARRLHRFGLTCCRFANRQNGDADLRLVVRGGAVGILSIELTAE